MNISKLRVYTLSLLAAPLIWGACHNDNDNSTPNEPTLEVLDPVKPDKGNPMKVYAHYMPWFETPTSSADKIWGQHWTMANCNPNTLLENGNRQIASNYYPIIGPYSSSDATVLNYHALLMKYSGIDGVMIDWYGTNDAKDYAANKYNTEQLVKAIERVGLTFAIVYEDQTLSVFDSQAAKTTQAQRDMRYLQSTFFNKTCYVKIDNKPLLMDFGPQQLQKPSEWTTAFSVLTAKPTFVVLNGFSATANGNGQNNSQGEFLWVNANPNYSNATDFSIYIGGAMPGFNDYYKKGGWGDGYTTYDSENGQLFDRQLKAAADANLKYLQISTWNDFGEGTTIEPTIEYGYQYLEKLQTFTKIDFDKGVLESIHRWYKLTKANSQNNEKMLKLTQAFYYFIAMQPEKAEQIMETI